MVCEKAGALEAGDNIKFLTLKEAKIQYPEYFANVVEQDEEKTWVSIAETEERIGIK